MLITPVLGIFSYVSLKKEDMDEDDQPISKQLLSFMMEANEVKMAIGFWTLMNILVIVLLIYITIKVSR